MPDFSDSSRARTPSNSVEAPTPPFQSSSGWRQLSWPPGVNYSGRLRCGELVSWSVGDETLRRSRATLAVPEPRLVERNRLQGVLRGRDTGARRKMIRI